MFRKIGLKLSKFLYSWSFLNASGRKGHQQEAGIGIFSTHPLIHSYSFSAETLILTTYGQSTLVGALESSGEVLAPCWSKKSKNRCIQEGNKKPFHFTYVTLPSKHHSSVLGFLPQGTVRAQ